MDDASLARARAAKKRAQELFGSRDDVVGIGLTTIGEEYGLKLNVRGPAGTAQAFPREVDGVAVKVEVVGEIRKRPSR